MRKFKSHIKGYLPSVILISILLILPSCRDIRENGLFRKRSLKKALLWAQQDSIRVADSLKSTLIVGDLAGDALHDSIVFSEDDLLYGEDISNQYCIISGTFSKPENAKKVAEQFRSQGYQAAIIRRTDSYGNILEMVSVKTFSNYIEAVSYKNEFRRKVDSSAWVYSIH